MVSAENAHGATGAGTVMLDIGAGTGALVLYTPAGLAGSEIEISPNQPGASRTHASVRERPGSHGSRHAAVYPGLPAGDYTIWGQTGAPVASVTITGGEITCAEWPSTP